MTRKNSLIAVAVLAVAFVAAFLALREPDPQAVLRRAQVKLAAEKTMHVEALASLLGAPKEIGSALADDATGIDIAIRADLDRTDPVKPASVSTFEFKQQLSGHQARLAGETRRKDGTYYLHLDAAEGLQDSGAEKLVGVWAKSDRPLTELLVPPTEEALAEHPLDGAGIQALRQALAAVDVFKADKKLPSEKVGGQDAYHYVVETNMETVSALLLKLRELRSPAPLTSADILAVTNEIIQWGKPIGEVWIGKRDGRVLKVMLQTQLSSGDGSTAGGAIVQLEFSRYGQPVDVKAPQAQDLESLLGPEFTKRLSLAGGRASSGTGPAPSGGALPTAPGAAADVTDSDGDGLVDGQEFFYGSDAWNPDTDGDGWTDGLEVEKGMNPVGPGTLFGFGL